MWGRRSLAPLFTRVNCLSARQASKRYGCRVLSLRVSTAAIAALLGALCLACPAQSAPAPEVPKVAKRGLPPTFMRGVTLSCPTWGPIWGRPETGIAMDQIKGLGANWVAIHPYARVGTDGEVKAAPAVSTGFLKRSIEMAKARDLKMLWKPHLAYWGSFQWRGKIAFEKDAHWERFFSEYTRFIVDQARAAEQWGAEMFVVGLEYEATVHRDKDWRKVIAAVRAVYRGPIVYSANWDGLAKVPFWDAVDVIGVQMYMPLAAATPPDAPPTDATLAAGWEAAMARLRALSKKHRKPLLFAEIGYAANKEAASAPWKPANDPQARPLRARLLRQALQKMESEKMLIGAFWWKWMPNAPGRHDADFSMKDPEAIAALKDTWAKSAPRPLAPSTLP